jgi:hypothetical protein
VNTSKSGIHHDDIVMDAALVHEHRGETKRHSFELPDVVKN